MRRLLALALLVAMREQPLPGAEAGSAAAAPRPPSPASYLDKLLLPTFQDRLPAIQKARLERKAAIQKLYWIVLQCAPDPDRLHNAAAAMELLGDLRASEAAPLLAENLKFALPREGPAHVGVPFPYRPQMKALIDIGLPSLDPVLKAVSDTDDKVVVECAAKVVDQILGTDFAVLFVKDRQQRETDPLKRQRLRGLEEQIDKVERNRKPKPNAGPLRPWPSVTGAGNRDR